MSSKRYIKHLLSFFLLSSSITFAQPFPSDSAVVDRYKNKVAGPADSIAQKLTTPSASDFEKVQSIFRRITENIAYDTKGYYNLDNIYAGLFQPVDSLDSATVYKNYDDNIVKKVLRDRVAICDGYSRLFKSLCNYANIRSEIVLGYVRWYTDSIGLATKRIHAWNAVHLNNQWYLLDPTWASGFSNTDVTQFKKEYDAHYFLTPPEDLINDHFPLDIRWQFISRPITLNAFYNQPYLFSAFRKFNISSYKPATGIIEARVGDTILFELETGEPDKQMVVLPSLVADSTDIFNHKNIVSPGKISYSYRLSSDETKELNVIYKGEPLIRYGVRIIK